MIINIKNEHDKIIKNFEVKNLTELSFEIGTLPDGTYLFIHTQQFIQQKFVVPEDVVLIGDENQLVYHDFTIVIDVQLQPNFDLTNVILNGRNEFDVILEHSEDLTTQEFRYSFEFLKKGL